MANLLVMALAACAQAPEPVAMQTAAPVVAEAPPAPAAEPAPVAPPAWIGRLTDAVKTNALKLDYAGGVFSGPGWDKLVAEGKAAQFLLVGEEHGIAENPKLMGQLFETLAKDGYSKFVIEVSPPMALALDRAAHGGGLSALKKTLLSEGGAAAFFTMQEEAEMLARVRAAVPGEMPVFWGVDYEVGGDRLLIKELEGVPKTMAAGQALDALYAASTAAWAKYAAEKNPGFIFSFSGDPALVRAVRDAWTGAPPDVLSILKALEETLEINALWVAGRGFDSNVRRSENMRKNFLDHWQAERAARRKPKVLAKMGLSHLVRGRNMSEVYDLGALVPELAAIEGVKALQVGILQGKGSSTAVFDPVAWRYSPSDPKDNYMQGLDAIYAGAHADAFTLIDLRAVRPAVSRWREGMDPELIRIVHGLDLLLIMSGSTASANLQR